MKDVVLLGKEVRNTFKLVQVLLPFRDIETNHVYIQCRKKNEKTYAIHMANPHNDYVKSHYFIFKIIQELSS